MNREELIELAIQERLCACFRKALVGERRRVGEKIAVLRNQLQTVSPELAEMYEECLETIAEVEGTEEAAYYRCGFQDGVCLMNQLIKILEKEGR